MIKRLIHSAFRKCGFDIVRIRPRSSVNDKVVRATGNVVHGGPFDGMKLPAQDSWGDRGSKLLAFYELELHAILQGVIRRPPDLAINVGCAEGYYAVGLARAMPTTPVIAYDIDPNAQDVCRLASEMNSLTNLDVRGLCTPEELAQKVSGSKRTFLFLDCEGGERELLVSNTAGFENSQIVVECHDHIAPRVTADMMRKFEKSHELRIIKQGARNPFDHPVVAGWPERELWELVCERRRQRGSWLHCIPKC